MRGAARKGALFALLRGRHFYHDDAQSAGGRNAEKLHDVKERYPEKTGGRLKKGDRRRKDDRADRSGGASDRKLRFFCLISPLRRSPAVYGLFTFVNYP